MTYPFLTLNDETEIVHSEMLPDGRVRVDIEQPDEKLCFKRATCWLPTYEWTDVKGFSEEDVRRLQRIIESGAHLIIEFSPTGGFDGASGL
jgi:hypothetical protein